MHEFIRILWKTQQLLVVNTLPQGDRKGPHPAPHHPRPYHEDERGITEQRVIVRAGVVWSGVGTLAVALGGFVVRNWQTRGVESLEHFPLQLI